MGYIKREQGSHDVFRLKNQLPIIYLGADRSSDEAT